MNSPTTSPPTAGSTSTPATANKPTPAADGPSAFTQASRVPLRRVGATLTGVRASTAQAITLIDGTIAAAQAGDWLVYQGAVPIAVVTAKDFPGPFEILVEGRLVLTRDERETLEQTTGVGTTRTAGELIQAVQRLARIRIGDVTIAFTPGQLEELAHRAQKRGQTVAQAVQAVVDRIKDELFWKG